MVCDSYGTAEVGVKKYPNLEETRKDHHGLGWAASLSLQISRGSCRLTALPEMGAWYAGVCIQEPREPHGSGGEAPGCVGAC